LLNNTCLSKSKLNKEYSETLNWLFHQFPIYQNIGEEALKYKLDNVKKISKALNEPEKSLKFIHIAGSNGKGSTSSMLASILYESGYKVGLFTSPHIKKYTERIKINGEEITETYVTSFIKRIKESKLNFNPSFFELTFGLALDYFNYKKCQICVIETGLGGRLDATNIIKPILSVITNISLEHTDILGNTIAKIAKEKAGIIKKDTPIVIGDMKIEAKKIIESEAIKLNSKIIESTKFKSKLKLFNLPLLGDYQLNNLLTVIASLSELNSMKFKSNNDIIQRGLNNIIRNTGFVPRMQIISKKPLIIYDVSHNVEGISISLDTIKNIQQGDLHIVFSSSKEKDIESILKIFPIKSNMYFTKSSNERSVLISDFKKISKKINFSTKKYFNDAKSALKNAKDSSSSNDTILVIGSFFLISDFL
tara:strand:+ start:69653 stop:70918 length:1266 start_codon:yes stop_codon:yes gene_type:complete